MNCHEAKNMITIGVFGGEPDSSERAALEDHLKTCVSCARIFERWMRQRVSFNVPDDIQLPDWEKSWQAVSGRALDHGKTFRLFGIPQKWVFAAASLITVFVLGFFAGRRFLRQPAGQPLPLTIEASAAAFPFERYAETLEPVLIDFMNRGKTERPQELVELEQRIIQSMLAETRLLESLTEKSQDAALQSFLEEMESLLVSMSNLKPGDQESADLLDRTIRERQIRFKLGELSAVKITI
jgi:hypothetical protein